MPVVTLEHITKRFPTITAVDDVSLDVEDGEFVTILGPSGSGKSTILRMIAGFEDPTEGSIVLDGTDVTDDPPFKRDVNMMFQDLALFPHLSVAANIAYGLKRQGVPKEERQRRVEEILSVVRLDGYGDRDPSELSGGEQQRVALARAIVNRPSVVLFDEPLASLDRKLRQHMQFELQRIQAETGITFVYVTHDQEVAMAVSDRLVLLKEGSIEQIGSVEELYDRPASRFVADFIGDVNVIPAELVDVSEEYEVRIGDEDVRFPRSASRNGLTPGSGVDVCVRPHEIDLSNGSSRDEPGIHGEVTNRVYKGDETTYRIGTSDTTFTVNSTDSGFDIGDEVRVTWPTSSAYLFASDS